MDYRDAVVLVGNSVVAFAPGVVVDVGRFAGREGSRSG